MNNNNIFSTNEKDGAIVLEKAQNFALADVFDCGQCFRFNKRDDGAYFGVAKGKYVEIFEKDGNISLFPCTKDEFSAIWHDFFDLGFDYAGCIESFGFDETLKKAASFAKGIRILHQDHWEALLSFIISQNNNIPRIKKIIEALCEKYGDAVYTDKNGKVFYSFPTPEKILAAGEKEIFDLKTGFRAKYIIDAAQKVCDGYIDLCALEKDDTETALKKLCTIKGVGPKVASCVLLFSYRKYDCFPIDVWVKKILAKYYPDFKGKEYFGEYAGIAQQYLFYYERCQSGVFLS